MIRVSRTRPLTVILAVYVLMILLWWGIVPEPVEQLIEQCDVTGQVASLQNSDSGLRLVLKDIIIKKNSKTIYCDRIIVFNNSKGSLFSQVKLGNIIFLKGSIHSFSKPGNPGQFNEYEYYRQLNMSYKLFPDSYKIVNNKVDYISQYMWNLRNYLCEKVSETIPKTEAGIMNAMLFGEKSTLPEDTKALYQKGGIAHLLAISGLHITVLGGALFFFLRKWIVRMQWAALFTIIFLLCYGELTGFSVATSRAVIMMICMLSAKIIGRSYDSISALCLSALITLLQRPFSIMQPGFLLSYGTILGIIYVVPAMEQCISWKKLKNDRWNQLLQGLLFSNAITITTLPIILMTYYEIPVYGVLVNFLVLPLVSILVSLGFVASVMCCISLTVGKFLFGTVHVILKYYEAVCQFVSMIPLSNWNPGKPDMWKLVVYYLGLLLFVVVKDKNWKRRSALLLLVIILPVSEPRIEFTMLDVGQGDGMLFRSQGITVLMDGGSSDVKQVGKYRIYPFLKWHGIQKIEVMCISHPDNDHVNGLLEILENKEELGIEVGEVFLPGIEKRDSAYHELLKRIQATGTKVSTLRKGEGFTCGSINFTCLYPDENTKSDDTNEYSMVLRASCENFSALLMGDLGNEGEMKLYKELKETTVLKVGHHGSKNSTTKELLEAIRPSLALVSAGRNNRYGHPSKETCKRLENEKISYLTTIESGAIRIFSDGKQIVRKTQFN